MAIVGDKFVDYVNTQIKHRQNALGKNTNRNETRSINNTSAFLTTTPYMSLSSAVKITKGNSELPGTSVYDQIKSTGLLDGVEEARWFGSNLARKCVLAGTANSATNSHQPFGVVGVNTDTNIPGVDGGATPYPEEFTKAYGWGYNANGIMAGQGYVPPPGVTSIDFEYKNDGALAMATVNIKAFSKEQFAIIDILYMRPGYTCLLEFGHSQYLNGGGELETYDGHSPPKNYLFHSGKNFKPSMQTMSEVIQTTKSLRFGNYEAFFARITKFNWKYNTDGSYDITVKLTGTGDVISSLNTLQSKTGTTPFSLNSKFESTPQDPPADFNNTIYTEKTDAEKEKEPWYETALKAPFRAGADLLESAAELIVDTGKDIQASLDSSIISNNDKEQSEEEGSFLIADAFRSQLNFDLYAIFADKELFNDGNLITNKNSTVLDLPLSKIPIGGKLKSFVIKKGVIKFDVFEKGFDPLYSPTTLITFGGFLAMLQKVCNIMDGNKNTLINFDIVQNMINGEGSNSYMVTYPGNFSADPNKCLINFKEFNKSVFEKVGVDTEGLPSLPKDTLIATTLNSTGKGKVADKDKVFDNEMMVYPLSDVYININMVADKLRSLANEGEDGSLEVPMLSLIDNILDEINVNCGGLNSFRTIFNEDTSLIEIISENPILNKKQPTENKPEIINTIGFDVTNQSTAISPGSFVKSLDLNSELSDKFASQISIGAQTNSNTLNGGATSFSAYSKGLIDHLMEEKKSTKPEDVDSDVDDKPAKTIVENLSEIWESSKVFSSFVEVYNDGNFDEGEYVTNLKNATTQLSGIIKNLYFQSGECSAPFFLPFNMSIDMHGLGGMKIYNSFQIDGKGLPLSYNKNDIRLIIKSLSHSVTVDSWTTKVSTISTPISKLSPSSYTPVDSASLPPSTSSNQGGGSGASPYTGKVLDGDPAPTINPNGFGATSYRSSPWWKYAKSQKWKNGQLNQSDKKQLVFIGETNGANKRYRNAAKNNRKEYMLAPPAASAWFKWKAEMDQKKISYSISSGYRNTSHQRSLGSGATVASPGSSPHGIGGALDFRNLYQIVGGSGSPSANLRGRKTETYKQIAEIGAKYGWFNPKRLADNAGSIDEMWHFEYWGSV